VVLDREKTSRFARGAGQGKVGDVLVLPMKHWVMIPAMYRKSKTREHMEKQLVTCKVHPKHSPILESHSSDWMQELEPSLLVSYQNSYPSLLLETSVLQEECIAQLGHDSVCPCSCSIPSMAASDTQ
jgi:hypothetical protein